MDRTRIIKGALESFRDFLTGTPAPDEGQIADDAAARQMSKRQARRLWKAHLARRGGWDGESPIPKRYRLRSSYRGQAIMTSRRAGD